MDYVYAMDRYIHNGKFYEHRKRTQLEEKARTLYLCLASYISCHLMSTAAANLSVLLRISLMFSTEVRKQTRLLMVI